MVPKNFFMFILVFLLTFISPFLLMNSRWGSLGFSTYPGPNSILTPGQPYKSLDLFMICSSWGHPLNPYNSCLSHLVGWLSLSSHMGSILFSPFTSLYKKFKGRYFRLFVESDDKPYFYDAEGKPKFLFYWTQSPTRYKSWSSSFMTSRYKEKFYMFDQLSNRLLTRRILVVY